MCYVKKKNAKLTISFVNKTLKKDDYNIDNND